MRRSGRLPSAHVVNSSIVKVQITRHTYLVRNPIDSVELDPGVEPGFDGSEPSVLPIGRVQYAGVLLRSWDAQESHLAGRARRQTVYSRSRVSTGLPSHWGSSAKGPRERPRSGLEATRK